VAKAKELLIERNQFGLWTVRYEGGGTVPSELGGQWPRMAALDRAIAAYQAKKEKPKRPYRKARGTEDAEKSDTTS